ncbi:MAG: hypothetical protein VX208_06230 [SAR324 cluster bacterium]|nr:hypothetical protein [SAR324 cluster bacterium]
MKGHSNKSLNLKQLQKISGIFLLSDGATQLRIITVLCLVTSTAGHWDAFRRDLPSAYYIWQSTEPKRIG